MLPDRMFGQSRGAGLLARSCPSVGLLPAGAAGEPPRPSEREMEGWVACRATDSLPPQIQAKMRCASQASPDIRLHAAKAGLSPNQAAEPLSARQRTLRCA